MPALLLFSISTGHFSSTRKENKKKEKLNFVEQENLSSAFCLNVDELMEFYDFNS